MLVETFIAELAIEAFDVGILRGRPRLDLSRTSVAVLWAPCPFQTKTDSVLNQRVQEDAGMLTTGWRTTAPLSACTSLNASTVQLPLRQIARIS